MNLFGAIIDAIIPPRCVVTGDVVDRDGALSPEAWNQLSFINDPFCNVCGVPFESNMDEAIHCVECLTEPPLYTQHRSCVRYDDISRKMILKFKHGDHINISRSFLPWLVRSGNDFWDDCDCLIPVPLHYWRLVKRRYNQSAIIAGQLSEELSIEWLPQTLIRHRSTVIQGHMNAKDRRKNVRDAFAVKSEEEGLIRNKSIVLIDDVYTTGSTVNECAKALFDAGANKVNVLTISRVVR